MTIEDMIDELAAAEAGSSDDTTGEWRRMSTREAAKSIIAWQESEQRQAEPRNALRERWYASCCVFDAKVELAQQRVAAVLNGERWQTKTAWQEGLAESRDLLE